MTDLAIIDDILHICNITTNVRNYTCLESNIIKLFTTQNISKFTDVQSAYI